MTSTEQIDPYTLAFSIPCEPEPDVHEDDRDLAGQASRYAEMRGISLTDHECSLVKVLLNRLRSLDSFAREMSASARESQKCSLNLELIKQACDSFLQIRFSSPVEIEDGETLRHYLRGIAFLVNWQPDCHLSEEGTFISVRIELING